MPKTVDTDALNSKLAVADPADVLLTPRETSFLTGKSLSALKKDRHASRGLPYVRMSYRDVRYRLADLRQYIAVNTIGREVCA